MHNDQHIECVNNAISLHQQGVIAFAHTVVHDEHLAKDVAQLAFIKLANKDCPSIKDKSAWLKKVCLNYALQALRDRKRLVPLPGTAEREISDTGAQSAGSQISAKEKYVELRRCLEALPSEQRKVATMIYIDQLSPKEVAIRLGKKRGTVDVLVHSALSSLRKVVTQG